MSSQELKTKPEYRAVTLVGGASLTIVLPRHFSEPLEVERGDYVKIVQDGKRLIVEKAN
jgi:antitoxin component of MazEF toxin-antitoxin module